jgi:hypothetical protein
MDKSAQIEKLKNQIYRKKEKLQLAKEELTQVCLKYVKLVCPVNVGDKLISTGRNYEGVKCVVDRIECNETTLKYQIFCRPIKADGSIGKLDFEFSGYDKKTGEPIIKTWK